MIDEEIPCKELSLNFMRGDILEVSNQDDPDWWQVSHSIIHGYSYIHVLTALLLINT